MDAATFHLYFTAANSLFLLLLGVVGYLGRTAVESMKEQVKALQQTQVDQAKDIVDVKVHYLLKDDFSEFKDELWRKLDDLKEIVKHNA
jgi:hypothetical protein